mgnify:CR=1 FL=1
MINRSLLMQAAAGAGGVEPSEYVGATSASGVSTLNAGSISGSSLGDTYILAAMDDNHLFDVIAPSWSGMTSGFPAPIFTNSIEHIVCTKTASLFGNSVSFEDTGDPHIVDAACAVAFRDMGTPPSTPTASQTASSSNFSVPSMTVTEEGSTSVIIAMIDDDNATISSVPSGYTLAVQNGRTGGSMAIMYQLGLSAGATGTVNGSWSSSDALLTYGYIIPPPA